MRKIMISQIFTNRSHKESLRTAYSKLIDLNPNDPYNKQKAAGALGGASRHGFIVRFNGDYVRVK